MMVQAMLSAPRPFRSSSPATKMPIAQLVRMRLMKKATSGSPSDQKLKPKKAIAEQRHRDHADQRAARRS